MKKQSNTCQLALQTRKFKFFMQYCATTVMPLVLTKHTIQECKKVERRFLVLMHFFTFIVIVSDWFDREFIYAVNNSIPFDLNYNTVYKCRVRFTQSNYLVLHSKIFCYSSHYIISLQTYCSTPSFESRVNSKSLNSS